MVKVPSNIYGNISDRERRMEVIIGNDTFDEINSSATCGIQGLAEHKLQLLTLRTILMDKLRLL